MRAIVLMFDSLNRRMLQPYAPDSWVKTPNFQRLAERAVTFDTSYVCSMPCMPARRDFHTGRPNFLHCPWSPLQPFDDSMPQMLDRAGVHTHLCSDDYHYWEDGGATYHTRYTTWEAFRGQEGDRWCPRVGGVTPPTHANGKGKNQDWVNRTVQATEPQMPQTLTVDAGLDFIKHNASADRWMLHLECFDPHEPFVAAERFNAMYPPPAGVSDEVLFDWPGYHEVRESPELVDQARRRYAALMTQCDASLGRVLDAMDQHQMWDDTMLIVCTDHGYMLGEHNCWAKNWMPLYEEVARTPFFVHDPRNPRPGTRCAQLVQPAIDLGPTLLHYFGLEATEHMTGHDLAPALHDDQPLRDAAMFGYFRSRINITDGRYVGLLAPVASGPCPQYTLMPTPMTGFLPAEQMQRATLAPPFSFTRGMPLLCIPQSESKQWTAEESLFFDLAEDPAQDHPLDDPAVTARLRSRLVELMQETDAPLEQYTRMGLDAVNRR